MNPPRGDGEWDRKSLFGIIFYYQRLQYQQIDIMPLGSYKVQKLKISENEETPGGFQMAQKSLLGQHLLLFLLYFIKTSKLIKLKYAQKHFESTFGSTHF